MPADMKGAPEVDIPANFASKASAGGQLEQPSEVNNSTTTGELGGAGVLASP